MSKKAKKSNTKLDKSKKYELLLLTIYTIATVIIAYVAITELPQIKAGLLKPNFYIDISESVKDNDIPIRVFNYGNGPATNVSFYIKSCYMDNYLFFHKEFIGPGEQFIIPFRDRQTIENYKKLDCRFAKDVNLSEYGRVEIMTYRDKRTGKILTPPITKSIDVCGYCYWTINITSNQGDYYQRVSTYSPIQLEYALEGDDFDPNDPNIEPYSSIEMAFFDYEMLNKQGVSFD